MNVRCDTLGTICLSSHCALCASDGVPERCDGDGGLNAVVVVVAVVVVATLRIENIAAL